MRYAKKIDNNQREIVDELRKRDISVALDHDDILVGYNGRTYWFEVKQSPRSNIQEGQLKLLNTWKGHYAIVWNLQMILNTIGYKDGISE